MLLKLHQAGQPILRKKAKPVTKEDLSSAKTQEVIDFMIDTLRDAPGVGLAAPQIGVAKQIIVIEDLAKYQKLVPLSVRRAEGRKVLPLTILVNPVLNILDDQTASFFEGCLSVDSYCAVVERNLSVSISGMDRNGQPVSFEASGWYARILQHEVDHLNGKLYIDLMKPKSFMTLKYFNMNWRDALPPKINRNFP